MATEGHSGGPGAWPQGVGLPSSKEPERLEKSKHRLILDEKCHLCSGGNKSLEGGRILMAAH